MQLEAKTLKCGETLVPVVQYGDLWYAPMMTLAKLLRLNAGVEKRRMARLPTWWNVVQLDVAFGYTRMRQPCLLLERLPTYLAVVACSRQNPRRTFVESLLVNWSASLEAFMLKHDAAYIVRHALSTGAEFDAETMMRQVEEEARARAIKQARRQIASHAASSRGRLSVEQFQRIKALKAQGEINSEIAKAVKCSNTTVSLVVNGKYPYPSDVAALI